MTAPRAIHPLLIVFLVLLGLALMIAAVGGMVTLIGWFVPTAGILS